MRKVAAIVVVVILSFNWFGYRGLISFMESKADEELEIQLNSNNYEEAELVSIKVPAIHLSNYINADLFERAYGQVEIENVEYSYVKRRLYNDSLELLCIPNQAATKLKQAKNDFYKLLNDLQHKGNKKTGTDFSKNISTDYTSAKSLLKLNAEAIVVSKRSPAFIEPVASYFSSPIENPPEEPVNFSNVEFMNS